MWPFNMTAIDKSQKNITQKESCYHTEILNISVFNFITFKKKLISSW